MIKVQKLSETPCTCNGSETVLPKTSICLSLIEESDAGVMFNETNTRWNWVFCWLWLLQGKEHTSFQVSWKVSCIHPPPTPLPNSLAILISPYIRKSTSPVKSEKGDILDNVIPIFFEKFHFPICIALQNKWISVSETYFLSMNILPLLKIFRLFLISYKVHWAVNARSEPPTQVFVNIKVFGTVTPCLFVNVYKMAAFLFIRTFEIIIWYRRFGGTCCFNPPCDIITIK